MNVRSTSLGTSISQLVPPVKQDFNLEEIQKLEDMDSVEAMPSKVILMMPKNSRIKRKIQE